MKSQKMKTIVITAIAILMISGTSLFAQRGMGMMRGAGQGSRFYAGNCMGYGLNLTEDQQNRVNDLRTAHLKEVQPLRDQLMENRAHQRTLMNAENADKKAINANIDKATKLQNEIAKLGADFQVKFKSVLTDEQKVMAQTRMGRFGRSGYGRAGYGMQRNAYQNGRRPMQRGWQGYGWNSPWYNSDSQDQ